MGPGKLKPAVADSGPLIHLNEIGCLPALRIFEVLYIPGAVLFETVGQNRISQNDLRSQTHVQEFSLPQSEIDKFI
ncbi:MAG: hypothetical protein JRI89_16605 [Deltaproteobacteria bacterium]|nr:hypothetical protein [Deltaproteobacteria bacterium]